jgi:hypothetical protein
MGTKYHVAYLRKLGVSKLLTAIPLTMDTFSAYAPHKLVKDWDKYTPLACLVLARECDVPAILPFCLWDTTPELPDDVKEYLGSHASRYVTEDGMAYNLDADTKLTCLNAGWVMSQRRQDNISWAVAEFECERKQPHCRGDGYVLALAGMLRGYPRPDQEGSISIFDNVSVRRWQSAFQLCTTCADEARGRWCTRTKETWDALPNYYGLASWEELIAASQ